MTPSQEAMQKNSHSASQHGACGFFGVNLWRKMHYLVDKNHGAYEDSDARRVFRSGGGNDGRAQYPRTISRTSIWKPLNRLCAAGMAVHRTLNRILIITRSCS